MFSKKNTWFACLLFLFNPAAGAASPCKEALVYAEKNLSKIGRLEVNEEGYVYVNIEDHYIHDLIAFIEDQGFEKPPYFENSSLVGAHITVIYPEEATTYHLYQLSERGKSIRFKPKECIVVDAEKTGRKELEGVDKICLITIDAPELEKIRKKYGLPKPSHEFHITIGVHRENK